MSKIFYAVVFFLIGANNSNSQSYLIAGNAFLKGQFVEVGISQCGSWGTTFDAPPNFHPRSGLSPVSPGNTARSLGFVADPDKDGWDVGTPNFFNGDYFLPGAPYLGWSLCFDGITYGTERTASTPSFCNYLGGEPPFPGYHSSLRTSALDSRSTWIGQDNGVQLRKIVTLKRDQLYFTIRVEIKNNRTTDLYDVYYGEYINPDNGAFSNNVYYPQLNTTNSILFNNPADQKSLVTATSSSNIYLGLGSKDCRSKTFIYEDYTLASPATVWHNGGTGFVYSGSTPIRNYAVGISFYERMLAPGDTFSFTYTYILKESDFDEALNETGPILESEYGTYQPSNTIYVCENTPLPLTIVNGNDYDWTWAATGGVTLSNTTGITSSISIADHNSYQLTLSGINSSCTKQLTFNIQNATPEIMRVITRGSACASPTGFIGIGTKGNLPLPNKVLCSIDGGLNWSNSNEFNNLSPGVYNVAIKNSLEPACVVNYTGNPVTISYIESPTVNAVPDLTICNNSTVPQITFDGSTVLATTYNWTNNNTDIGLSANGSGNISSFNISNPGTTAISSTIEVTPVVGSCIGTPKTFTITALPSPNVNTIQDQMVCRGNSTTGIQFSGDVAGTIFSWSNSNPSIGLAATGTGNILAFTTTSIGNTLQIANITVTPAVELNGTICNGATTTFTITVQPSITLNPVNNFSACNGASLPAINFSSNDPVATYTWTNNNPSIGLPASGSGNLPSFIGLNNSTSISSATIAVVATSTHNTSTSCASEPVNFIIAIKPKPNLGADQSQLICSYDRYNLLTGFSNTTDRYDFYAGTVPVINPSAVGQGNYTVIGTNVHSCTDTALVKILLHPAINLSVSASVPNGSNVMDGQQIQLFSSGYGIMNYSWSPTTGLNDTHTSSPTLYPIASTRYLLTATNVAGCIDTAGIAFKAIPLVVQPSSAFTPNNDGFTDKWVIKNIQYARNNKVAIFNRYGNKVYEASNYANQWDGTYKGKALPDGAYYYQLQVTTNSNKQISMSGSITIIR